MEFILILVVVLILVILLMEEMYLFLVLIQVVVFMQQIKQNIYVLGRDIVQGINNTTIYAESIYNTNFTQHSKKFVLSLHYNGNNSYLFVNGTQELQFKSSVNYSDRNLLCLGNISSDWTQTNSTKTGLYGNVYEIAIDYVPLSDVKTIYDIHRYLMKKHNI